VKPPVGRGGARADSAAPPQAVWDVLLDGRRWSFWNPGVEWMWLEGPGAPGTLVTIKLKGVRQTALVLTELLPPRRFGLALTIGPIARLDLTWTLSARETGTRIDAAVATSGLAGGLLLGRSAERIARALPGHLERLAAYAFDGDKKNARLQ
jgi:hypothetical protein